LNMDTTRLDLLNEIASALFKMKKYEEAAMAYKEKINSGTNVKSADYYGLGQSYFFTQRYKEADTAFAKVNELSPKWPTGYLWRAKTNYFLDSLKLELAKPYYEKYVELALEDSANLAKYKSCIVESYKLLADYAFRHKQSIDVIDAYYKKILEVDPADEGALNYFLQKKRAKEAEEKKKNP